MPPDSVVQQATEKPETNSSEDGVVSSTVAEMDIAAPVEALQGLSVWGPYRVAEEAETPVAYVPVVLKNAAIADEDFAGLGAGWIHDWSEKNNSIRIANETEIPIVYVISLLGPLYWGVLQPGQRATRVVGRIWFTVTCYPYMGDNEPTATPALSTLIPAAAAIIAAASGGAAAAVPAAGTAGAALAAIAVTAASASAAAVAGPALWAKREFVNAVEKAMNKVEKMGHQGDGSWIYVRGGIKKNQAYSAWVAMRFES